jgi:type III secretory pathway component EscS
MNKIEEQDFTLENGVKLIAVMAVIFLAVQYFSKKK